MHVRCNCFKLLFIILFLSLVACNDSGDASSERSDTLASADRPDPSDIPAETPDGDPDSGFHDGKVYVCHEPEKRSVSSANPHTISISVNALPAHLRHGDSEGVCEADLKTAAEVDPPEVIVDPELVPSAAHIAGIDGGPVRNLILMNSDIGNGYRFDFVENEIYLITDNEDELAGIVSRWGASVLFEVVSPDTGSPEDLKKMYLLNVDPSAADTSNLNEDLALLNPNIHGKHQVSSLMGLKLLALVASEIKNYGLKVGINILLKSQAFSERFSFEAEVGIDEGSFVYSRNGFKWPYMNHDPDLPGDELRPNDTGVAEAFRVVEAAGNLSNRVKALVADGGFYPNDDFPPFTAVGPMRVPNTDPTACGGTSLSAICSAHGTHVTLTGFGLPDNAFGTFGPGGPVTDLILLQSPAVDLDSIVRFITESIPAALDERPDIINLSASVIIPGPWCFLACEPVDFLGGMLDRAGIIFVAAAGNNNYNLDTTDTVCLPFCISFEEAAVIPCESDHVICVGANQFNEHIRTRYTNYGEYVGDNSVDIFAPGDVYSVIALNADSTSTLGKDVDNLQVVKGTSFASPFVAGVMALTWAANPSLTDDEVKRCVLNSAHKQLIPPTRRFPETRYIRRINALGAVQCAMGGTHPYLRIITPLEGQVYLRGQASVVLMANADDLEDGDALTINWKSSIDGRLGSTAPGDSLNLGPNRLGLGDHRICAYTSDTSSRNATDCVNITVENSPPVVTILQPTYFDYYDQTDMIVLEAIVDDLDGPVLTDIAWYIYPNGSVRGVPVVIGDLSTSLQASRYAPDQYLVALVVRDSDGGTTEKIVSIIINETSGNVRPVITITDPTPGQTFFSDGRLLTIPLNAFADDVEDGRIPFDQISWFVTTNLGLTRPLTVNSHVTCARFDPLLGCIEFVTVYDFELGPNGSDTSTRYDIKGVVEDSGMKSNSSSNGKVTIFINQLI